MMYWFVHTQMCNVNYFEYVMHIMYVYNMWDCFVLWAQGLEKKQNKNTNKYVVSKIK